MSRALRVTLAILIAGAMGLVRPFRVETPRWFTPGAMGREKSADLPSVVRPPPSGFLTRAFYGLRGAEGEEWGRRNGLGERLAFSHHLNVVFPPELYKTHPEFFPLVDGKRLEPPKGSYFWNPDLAREDVAVFAAEAARKHFETHPDEVSFALGVNDALIWGESHELLALTRAIPTAEDGRLRADAGNADAERRRRGDAEISRTHTSRGVPVQRLNDSTVQREHARWFRERPDYSNLVFTFMNRAAEELSRKHPDKYLGALAYYWCENTPGFPLHPQVIPFLTADRSQGYDPDFRREELELQTRWGQIAGKPEGQKSGLSEVQRTGIPGDRPENHASVTPGFRTSALPGFGSSGPERRLGMYDYLFGGGFLIPRIWTQLLAENLKHARSAGFTDYFAEVNPNWGLDGPMPWLTAQLLQDPEQSSEALLEEYYRRYFQEAAAPMRKFFARCEEQWMNQPGPSYWLKHYRNESQAIIFPSGVCRELRGYLQSAEQLAHSHKVRARVRLVSETFGVTERVVAFKESKDELARVALRLESDDGRQMTDGGRRSTDDARSTGGPAEGLSPGDRRSSTDRGEGAPAPRFATSPAGAGAPPPRHAVSLSLALDRYVAARREFIRYTYQLQKRQPLALHPFGWDDYLKNDPVALALIALTLLTVPTTDGGRQTTDKSDELPEVLAGEPLVAELWAALARPDAGAADQHELNLSSAVRRLPSGNRQLLSDPGINGAPKPGRMIAGLTYGVALPEPWQSRVEPAEYHEAGLRDRTTDDGRRMTDDGGVTTEDRLRIPGERRAAVQKAASSDQTDAGPSSAVSHLPSGTPRVLRISGTKDTMVSQWAAVARRPEDRQQANGRTDDGRQRTDGRDSGAVVSRRSSVIRGDRPLHVASIGVRGRVSPGTSVALILAWLDEKHRHVGFKTVRLPDGEWPELVPLDQAGLAPARAAWVGIGVRVQNQVAGDWVEVGNFSLREQD